MLLTHNANTNAVLTQCFDAANNLLIPNSVALTSANAITVGFSSSQTGKCVVNTSGGGSAGSSSFATMTGVASILQGGTGQSSRQAALTRRQAR